jgi:hypothetical protein
MCCTLLGACHQKLSRPYLQASSRIGGGEFYKTAAAFDWKQRDSFAKQEILNGNFPSVLRIFTPVVITGFDKNANKKLEAVFYVLPDYLAVGKDDDWVRIPLTPMAAQSIADSFQCFLPTRKLVDAIYRSAVIKLEPQPLFAFRDSSPTMLHHHLIIEGQRKGQKGLIAGIKKDVVISGKINQDKRPNRVAIYGWHKPDGKPIQPLYTGHVNWYVDYSHGIRLVYRKVKVNGKWMDYIDVLKNASLHHLICDEDICDFYRYPY